MGQYQTTYAKLTYDIPLKYRCPKCQREASGTLLMTGEEQSKCPRYADWITVCKMRLQTLEGAYKRLIYQTESAYRKSPIEYRNAIEVRCTHCGYMPDWMVEPAKNDLTKIFFWLCGIIVFILPFCLLAVFSPPNTLSRSEIGFYYFIAVAGAGCCGYMLFKLVKKLFRPAFMKIEAERSNVMSQIPKANLPQYVIPLEEALYNIEKKHLPELKNTYTKMCTKKPFQYSLHDVSTNVSLYDKPREKAYLQSKCQVPQNQSNVKKNVNAQPVQMNAVPQNTPLNISSNSPEEDIAKLLIFYIECEKCNRFKELLTLWDRLFASDKKHEGIRQDIVYKAEIERMYGANPQKVREYINTLKTNLSKPIA